MECYRCKSPSSIAHQCCHSSGTNTSSSLALSFNTGHNWGPLYLANGCFTLCKFVFWFFTMMVLVVVARMSFVLVPFWGMRVFAELMIGLSVVDWYNGCSCLTTPLVFMLCVDLFHFDSRLGLLTCVGQWHISRLGACRGSISCLYTGACLLGTCPAIMVWEA